MKRKIVGLLFAVILVVSGCGMRETNEPSKKPSASESTKEPVDENDGNEGDSSTEEKNITLYYVDDATGEIATKEITVKGDLSEQIVAELKAAGILSDACAVESVSVNEAEKKIDLAVNQGFGDYIRGMGTTGESQVLECLVKTYTKAYGCKEAKITEQGNPLETGHALLDGYISYE